jgi:hypothetical protein
LYFKALLFEIGKSFKGQNHTAEASSKIFSADMPAV